ncbi:uncharacterized protein Bfra_011149 [Botrytis fragariae]|uniref:Uncharacterized protein n=1 Tax=Botrytis fragariae TaxID=1964551 RepID=A0A8H6EEI1_9HELO|nr:uncharacterized protein Bfra_011149 [Botrytis fragariae]KAF5869342.1 hypothetical protein Bfra_011149 [Botrytis fragariae]
MSIRSAAGSRADSRAGRRPISVFHAVAPSSPSSGSYFSSISRPELILPRTTYAEPYDDDLESYGSRSSDSGSEIREEHDSTSPRTSTHHQPHDVFDEVRSHMRRLEEDVAHTRQVWSDGEINPSDMLSTIANYRRGLDMVATPDAGRDPSLKLRIDEVDDTLEELEAEANVRKMREQEGLETARKEAERRENEMREESERHQYFMRDKGAKERIRNEKEAKKREKAEEEKQKRIIKENKRKEQNTRSAAAFKERERLAKEEKKRKEEQRIQEEKKAYEKRSSREKAARNRDLQRRDIEKKTREAEEEARYQKKVTEEEKRYVAKKNHQTKAKVALGGREEESRKRERERAEAFAKKVVDDRNQKLKRELKKLEDKICDVEEKLGYVHDD